MAAVDRPSPPVGAAADARQSGSRIRRLAAIVESSEDAIIAMDLEGRIVEWNGSAERLFGYRREEVLERSIEILMPPDRADDWRQILRRVSTGESVEHFETRRRTRDGRILNVSLTVSPVRDEGRIAGAAKIVRDITAEQVARRESEKTRELLLGTLGHDLRTPLNTINVSVHTLKRHATDADQKVLQRISSSTDRMARMIDQLLDFTQSRLGGGIPIHPHNADLTAICRTLADEFEALHPGRVRLTTEGNLKGCWDGDRLAEVLSNLLSNAFKYGDSDAPVTIAGRCGDGCVVVDVTNQGPEIPTPLQDVIFDPFQRGPAEQYRGIKGIGLGLYIAQQIVRAHGGEITVRSSPVAGTTFSVSLPRSVAGTSTDSTP
jgi:PAS domain S-box-containing protein